MKINEELKALIPPLSADELAALEKSIIDEGCRDPLILWDDTLIDGHNRYDICIRNGIEYRTISKDFDSIDDVKVWMIDNSFARRNINDFWKYELSQVKADILRKKGREKLSKLATATNTGSALSINDKPEHNTQKELAKGLGWSTGKLAQADVVAKKAPVEIKEKLRSGDLTIGAAYKEVKKAERTKEIAEKRHEIAEKGASVKKSDRWNVYHDNIETWEATKQYDWIITDPPYPKEYLPLWEVLAERAKKWLKPGGLLLAMSGQMYLDEIYEMMARHLDYYWTGAYLTPGQPTPLRHRNVNTTWKPILIFSNGEYKGKIFGDVWKSDGNDKDNHKWGQSVSGMYDIISKICLPGESILDPFCGAGTTGVSALKHGCFFDGVELLEENVNISKGRLSE